jgi:hypothetical protein
VQPVHRANDPPCFVDGANPRLGLFATAGTPLREVVIAAYRESPIGTLGNLIHRPLPTPLSLFHGLQHANPIGRVVFGNRKLYGLTRTRQRFRCLKIGNRLGRSLTALVVFVIAGKARVAIDSVPVPNIGVGALFVGRSYGRRIFGGRQAAALKLVAGVLSLCIWAGPPKQHVLRSATGGA